MSASNVIAQSVGGQKKVLDNVETVADAREALGLDKDFAAVVNGESQSDNFKLSDTDYVSFSRKVKGGK